LRERCLDAWKRYCSWVARFTGLHAASLQKAGGSNRHGRCSPVLHPHHNLVAAALQRAPNMVEPSRTFVAPLNAKRIRLVNAEFRLFLCMCSGWYNPRPAFAHVHQSSAPTLRTWQSLVRNLQTCPWTAPAPASAAVAVTFFSGSTIHGGYCPSVMKMRACTPAGCSLRPPALEPGSAVTPSAIAEE
jgi:hypothetical protein